MNPLRKLAVVVVAMACASVAQADPIRYDEAVDGDLLSTPGFREILEFGLGKNRITGDFRFIADCLPTGCIIPFDVDFDPFRFVIPSGLQVVNVTFSWAADVTEFTDVFVTQFILFKETSPPYPQLSHECFTQLTSGGGCTSFRSQLLDQPAIITDMFDDALPLLDSGLYFLAHPGLGAGIISSEPETLGGFIDYSWTFDVKRIVPVPEPGTFALLMLGLLGMGLSRRRRKV